MRWFVMPLTVHTHNDLQRISFDFYAMIFIVFSNGPNLLTNLFSTYSCIYVFNTHIVIKFKCFKTEIVDGILRFWDYHDCLSLWIVNNICKQRNYFHTTFTLKVNNFKTNKYLVKFGSWNVFTRIHLR